MSKEKLLVEISARHAHLSEADLEVLFGEGYKLTPKKDLSQPGQYACEEKVTLRGPKGEMKLSVLGPTRKETQVELSLTDARTIGVKAAIRESGDIAGTVGAAKSKSLAKNTSLTPKEEISGDVQQRVYDKPDSEIWSDVQQREYDTPDNEIWSDPSQRKLGFDPITEELYIDGQQRTYDPPETTQMPGYSQKRTAFFGKMNKSKSLRNNL